MESSTPRSSVVSTVVVVVGKNKNVKASTGSPGESSKTRYLERVNDPDLEDLAYRRELMEFLRLKSLSHKDLSNHFCVGWLKAHEAHFSRDKALVTADLTGISKESIFSKSREAQASSWNHRSIERA